MNLSISIGEFLNTYLSRPIELPKAHNVFSKLRKKLWLQYIEGSLLWNKQRSLKILKDVMKASKRKNGAKKVKFQLQNFVMIPVGVNFTSSNYKRIGASHKKKPVE